MLKKSCFSIDFSANGKYFASGSGDGVVRIINIEKNHMA
jgi:WD40 repeat protein